MSKLKDATFKLEGGNIIKIYHNIPESGNINSAYAAFANWEMRTNEFTAKSLCDYINSKGIHQAYTEEEYKNLNQ